MRTQMILSALALIVALTLSTSAQNSGTRIGSDGYVADMSLGTADASCVPAAIKNYMMGLKSGNDGLVESSLYYAVRLRIAYPDTNLTQLESTIDDLVTDGKTQRIRYMAYLASTLFASPALVDSGMLEHADDVPSFFASVSKQLQDRLIVRND